MALMASKSYHHHAECLVRFLSPVKGATSLNGVKYIHGWVVQRVICLACASRLNGERIRKSVTFDGDLMTDAKAGRIKINAMGPCERFDDCILGQVLGRSILNVHQA